MVIVAAAISVALVVLGTFEVGAVCTDAVGRRRAVEDCVLVVAAGSGAGTAICIACAVRKIHAFGAR